MSEIYTTNTASLKATTANIRMLNTKTIDAKKIKVDGKNLIELIGENSGGIKVLKHAKDTRETVTENDLWGQYIETLEDGTAIVHDDEVVNPNKDKFENNSWNIKITKVEDNKTYIEDEFYANIQTEKIKDGTKMFNYCSSLSEFDSDLSSLTDGYWMFRNCEALTTFTSDLSSLANGYGMFCGCSNLLSFTSDLSSLTNGEGMFYGCSNLTAFTNDLSSLTNGVDMFQKCSNLTSFSSNLSSVTNGFDMFWNCTALTSFSSDLSSLTDGQYMFRNCVKLTTFTSDLSSLTNGYDMFSYCSKLTTFTSDLSSLTNGGDMFYGCTALTSFSSDLSSLTNGEGMFYGCSALTSFTSDLSSLTDGRYMFYGCTALTSFSSDLSSLMAGYNAFNKTKLTPKSVMYIVDSIKDIAAEKKLYEDGILPYVTKTNYEYSATKGFMSDGTYVYTYKNTDTIHYVNVGKLTIGINVTNDANTINDQLQTFAEGTLFDTWDDLKKAFVDKGWTVTWQYGGTTTSITYDMRGDRVIPCPIYAQLIEILPQEGEEELSDE